MAATELFENILGALTFGFFGYLDILTVISPANRISKRDRSGQLGELVRQCGPRAVRPESSASSRERSESMRVACS